MPSNIKTWENIKRADYQMLVQNLRSKGFSTPYSDGGMLRSAASGLSADVTFEERTKSLTVRVREGGSGETYSSIFNMLDTTIRSTNR